MELKTFKTYLSEQEQLDEFLGAIVAGARAIAPLAGRLFGRAAASRVGTAATATGGRVSNILKSKGIRQAAVLGGAQAIASKLIGGQGGQGGSNEMDSANAVDSGQTAPTTSIQSINPSNTASVPQAVRSIGQSDRIPGLPGTSTIALQSMYGGLRAKMGRM